MVTVYDVDANRLIKNAADKLKEMGIAPPKFVGSTKTGPHAERLPQEKDFWYVRLASLMRKAYIGSPIGVARLRTHYGGRKKRGVRPERHRDAGGNIIRKGLQSLEKAGLLKTKKVPKPGRYITPAGQKLLDACAKQASTEAKK